MVVLIGELIVARRILIRIVTSLKKLIEWNSSNQQQAHRGHLLEISEGAARLRIQAQIRRQRLTSQEKVADKDFARIWFAMQIRSVT
jgi:hypothetical protein